MMTKEATHSTAKLSSTKAKASTSAAKKTSLASTKSSKSCAKSCTNNCSYATNGLTINPTSFTSGDKIKITYTGLLLQCGANEIYAHVGWGDSWEDVNDIKMSKTKAGFTATITVKKSSVLNMCFKDALDNWDNNNGYNYGYDRYWK